MHLRAAREIVFAGGAPRLAALGPIEPATEPRFGFLEAADERSNQTVAVFGGPNLL
jgi:hypothetical protein